MSCLIAFFISSFLGYLILRQLRPQQGVFCLKDIFVIFGLGTGLSAQIIFYSLLLADRIDPVFIILVHSVILGVLFFCRPRQTAVFSLPIAHSIVLGLILVPASALLGIMAAVRPYGDWDAWSYWNFHANFLFHAGHAWRDLFPFNFQAHHPWMLPLLIIWGWIFEGTTDQAVPIVTAVFFALATIGLLMSSLKKYVSLFWVALAGIFLTSINFFAWHATSQYADIESAFFVLLSCVLSLDVFESPSSGHAVLTGLSLGITASTKDNGIVAAFIFIALMAGRLMKKGLSAQVWPMVLGFGAVVVSVAIMKFLEFYHLSNHWYNVSLAGLWDWHRFVSLAQSAFESMISGYWGELWFLTLIVFIFLRGKLVLEGPMTFLIWFMFLFVASYFLMFMGSGYDLQWLLNVAGDFDRTLYMLAPTMVFVLFYAMGNRGLE